MRIHGSFDEARAGHPEAYFAQRDNIVLDFRGDLRIDPTADLTWDCRIITAAHAADDIHGPMVLRKVHIGRGAWVGSGTTLYNCVIGEDAIVSIGSVVANRIVPPNTIVEGNPAMAVAVRTDLRAPWVSLPSPQPLERI